VFLSIGPPGSAHEEAHLRTNREQKEEQEVEEGEEEE